MEEMLAGWCPLLLQNLYYPHILGTLILLLDDVVETWLVPVGAGASVSSKPF